MHLTWTRPCVVPTPEVLADYHIQAVEGDNSGSSYVSASDFANRRHHFTHLTGGTSHSIRVRAAYTDATTGPWSVVLTPTPVAAASPENLSAAVHPQGGVLVTYTPIPDHNDALYYDLQAVEGTTFSGDTLRTAQTHSGSHRFRDPDHAVLKPGVSHSMRIRSMFLTGRASDWSSTIAHTPAVGTNAGSLPARRRL